MNSRDYLNHFAQMHEGWSEKAMGQNYSELLSVAKHV